METPKIVVLVVKRYAVLEAQKWRYAVCKAKIRRYAVRNGGRGVTLLNWVSVLRLITMNCSGEVIRQLQAYVLNLLFS